MKFLFQTQSIHVKMIISVGLVFTVCMATGGYFIIKTQEKQRLLANQRRLEVIETTIERSLAYAMGMGRSEEVQATLEMIGAQKYIKTLRIFSDKGVILRSAKKEEIGKKVDSLYMDALQKEDYRFVRKKENESHEINTLIQPIPNHPRCYSCHDPAEKITGVLEIGISLAFAEKDIALLYKTVASIVIATLIIMCLIGTLLQFNIIHKPLKELTSKMKDVEAGDLNARVKLEQNDELGRLGKGFNAMVQKLDQAQKEVKRYHQEQMARVDRLASIGEMAAGLAHEIRNPLTGISGAVQIIADDFDSQDPRTDITVEILKQIDRVNNTIKDLLAYSRPPSPHLKKSDIHNVLDEAIFLTSPAAVKNQVKIEKSYCSTLPAISLDTHQIQQVFLNIFLNAVQAMPKGGNLIIKTGLKKDEGNDKILVEAKDDGPGISPESINKIFKPFFSTKHKGTGLGLSVVQTIMEQHKGNITVESGLGKGTTFSMIFPII